MTPYTEGLEPVGDASFFVRRWGDPSLPKLLMLHGFPEYGGAWSGLAPLLADRFHCTARNGARRGTVGGLAIHQLSAQ